MLLLALTLSGPILAQDYHYDPYSRRDPFQRWFGSSSGPNLDNPTRLQKYEPSDLRLLGVVWGDVAMAMVEDPDRHVHVLSEGTYVGPRWGRVTAITRDGVVVTEELLDAGSRLVIQEYVLALPIDEAYDLGR